MSDTAIIKEFLVQLGFKVDADSEKKFSNTLAAVTVKAVELGAAITGAAALMVASVAKIADGLEDLYFKSERIKASVENIQSFGFAMRQMGGSAEGAVASLESVARLLRNSPGGEGLLKNIGIQTRDANGNLRDTVEMMGDLGKKFADMPYYEANAYAQALGIDEKSLMAMRQGMGEFGEQYKEMMHAAGFNAQEAAKSSHAFMSELRLLQGAVTILTQKIASSMTSGITPHVRQLRELFVSHFGEITKAVTDVLTFIFKLADAVSIMAMRGVHAIGALIDWFHGLSDGSKKVIEWIGGILIAWRLLNAGFLSTPLGRVLALVTALGLLWDDYQVWKAGGKSFIDWEKWSPGIEAAIRGVKSVIGFVQESTAWMGDWQAAFDILLVYFTTKWVTGMIGGVTRAATSFGGTLAPAIAGLARNTALVGAAGIAGYAIGTLMAKGIDSALTALTGKDTSLGTWIYDLTHKGEKKPESGVKAGVAAAHVSENVPTDQRVKSHVDLAALHGDKASLRAEAERQMAEARKIADGQLSAPTAPTPEGSWGIQRGLRNNNPGNINYGSFAKSHGSTGLENHGADSRFATFGTAQEGLNALADLLRQYVSKGTDTVSKIISKYAPAGDNNDTAAYIAAVAKRMGVDANQKLDLNPAQLQSLIGEIVRVENTKNPYSKEMLAKASTSIPGVPGAKAGAVVTQTTHITVHGATDPKATAGDISTAQNDVNERLTRNMRGAVSL